MKAEHRKELQTNVLADYLGRAIESLKTGHTTTVILAVAVVLVGLVLLYNYFAGKGSAGEAALWTKLDRATDQDVLSQLRSEEALAALAETNPGTTQARTANFELARMHMQNGTERFGNPEHHAAALKDLAKARQLYQELAPLCTTEPILQQEALMGMAKAEESLVGVDGSIDKAIGYYQEVASKDAESFQGQAAKERADTLTKNKKQIESFYVKLNQQASKK